MPLNNENRKYMVRPEVHKSRSWILSQKIDTRNVTYSNEKRTLEDKFAYSFNAKIVYTQSSRQYLFLNIIFSKKSFNFKNRG